MTVETVDVLIVGGASAGWAAAVAAREAGAERVVVLEKAPLAQIGGNSRFSNMGFRFTHEGFDDLIGLLPEVDRERHMGSVIGPYTAQQFLADLNRVTRNRIDPVIAETLVTDSRDAIDWMTSLGHRWQFHHPLEVDGRTHYNAGKCMNPIGGGLGLVEKWMEIGVPKGIEFRDRSRLAALHGNHRKIEGARVNGPDGDYDIQAASVILASGGFQASAEKRSRYLPSGADGMKVRGSRHNTGEVLQMAIDLGANTSGQWGGAHASPIDLHSSAVEVAPGMVNRYGYTYGISVNQNAERFFDEGEAHRGYTYAKTGWAYLAQPGAAVYQIFDQQCVGLLPPDYHVGKPIQANTIRELAEQIGLDPGRLEATIAEYNSSIDTTVEFDPTRDDGRGTVGLAVKRTNWAVAIEQTPFVAYEATGGITFSFGGLAVDRDARTLNSNGDPIEGLYANGDIVGMFFYNYPSLTGMTRNVVFGGRAGAHAATR